MKRSVHVRVTETHGSREAKATEITRLSIRNKKTPVPGEDQRKNNPGSQKGNRGDGASGIAKGRSLSATRYTGSQDREPRARLSSGSRHDDRRSRHGRHGRHGRRSHRDRHGRRSRHGHRDR